MRTSFLCASVLVLATWAVPTWAQVPEPTPDCNAYRCAVQAAIDANCPCGTADNHGRYVSCVAHQVKQLSNTGVIPKRCKGKVQRCAARSTCGKAGRETCRLPGTCDLTTGTCVRPASGSCTSDADCVTCKMMWQYPGKTPTPGVPDQCTLLLGTPGTGTCCPACQ